MTFVFANRVFVNDDVLDAAAKQVIGTIAKAVPEECLCVAVINEILERSKSEATVMPIASFRQCLEANRK